MAFQFRPGESVDRGVRRMARAQIRKALKALEEHDPDGREKAIHSARKSFKRLRALVRLAREGLGDEAADREDARFRDAGRPLSEARDAAVLVQALDALIEKFGDGDHPEVVASARSALVNRREGLSGRGSDDEETLSGVIESVREALHHAKRWKLHGDGWDVLESGLKRIYKRGVAAFEEASRSPTDESLHEWRKRAKDLWYAMDLLRPIRPAYTDRRAEEASKLSDLLGDDHDLAVLGQALAESAPESVPTIAPLIARRRALLQRDAFGLGRSLYAERPKRFLARMGAYWHAWRAEHEAADFDAE